MNYCHIVLVIILAALVGLFTAFVTSIPFWYISNYVEVSKGTIDGLSTFACVIWICGYAAGALFATVIVDVNK